jgi:ABC-type transport system involved in cytochrome c biogenesis permease subunit
MMMLPASAIPFYLAAVAYAAAGFLSLRYIRGSESQILIPAKRMAAAGNLLLLAVFLYRWWQFNLIPFTGLGDSLNLFLVLCTGIILSIQRVDAMRPLLAYYLPALAILALINASVGHLYLNEPPKELNGFLVTFHVGLIFLSFALFFIASLTSLAYVNKARSLKRMKTTGLMHKFPSLEQIDKTLYELISVGYPTFAVTLLMGFIWAWTERDRLGDSWYISPRIILAVVMVGFYAACFHIRQYGLLRGPKLAYVVFFAFVFFFLSYLGIELLQYGGYSLWEAKG